MTPLYPARPPRELANDNEQVTAMSQPSAARVFTKDTLIRGTPARIECVSVGGQTFSVARGLLSVVRLEDEWYQEVQEPYAVIEALKRHPTLRPDLFTFCQRLPNVVPTFNFRQEWESIAAVPIDTYQYWWEKQIEGATRNKIRKSRKLGVEVRECSYDDEFVHGMTAIFNETPVRQGRRFWHYGKDFETVKRQFARYLFREDLLGAYYKDELVGFAMLGKSASYGDLGQIISKIEHRDKATTNALIAKAVELCATRGLKHLAYAYWTHDSLGEFKRQSGFREVKLPRYFIPLTRGGELAMRAGLHRGWRELVPSRVAESLRRVRRGWYDQRERRAPRPQSGVE